MCLRKGFVGAVYQMSRLSLEILLILFLLIILAFGPDATAGDVLPGSSAVSGETGSLRAAKTPVDIEDLLNLGKRHLETGRYERAIMNYSKIRDVLAETDNPNLATAYFNRGLAYHLNGDYGKAIEDFGTVLTMNPNDDKALYHRGNAHALTNSVDKAIEDYSSAIRLNPDDARLYYLRGLTYQERPETIDLALADFHKAVSLDPSDKKIHCFLGIAYYKQHEYRSAVRHFGMAIDIDPHYGEAYTGRGQAYLRSGHMTKALVDFGRACERGERAGCAMIELLAKTKKEVPAPSSHAKEVQNDEE